MRPVARVAMATAASLWGWNEGGESQMNCDLDAEAAASPLQRRLLAHLRPARLAPGPPPGWAGARGTSSGGSAAPLWF